MTKDIRASILYVEKMLSEYKPRHKKTVFQVTAKPVCSAKETSNSLESLIIYIASTHVCIILSRECHIKMLVRQCHSESLLFAYSMDLIMTRPILLR